MAEVRQHREMPDLLKQLEELYRRVTALENARRLGNSSVDTGELSVRGGDIVVRSNDDNPVMILEHGNSPRIRMVPDWGLDYFETWITSWEGVSGSVMELGIKQTDTTQDGGKLLLMRDSVYLSKQPATPGMEETYFAIAPDPAYYQHFYFKGKWMVNQFSGQDGLVLGFENVAAGFGAASVNFPYAFDTTPFLMYTLFSAVGPVSHNLATISTTGFTVSWSGTTAKSIYWQAWRI